MLINYGISGTSFHGLAHGACLEQFVPSRPDLLILEHLPHLDTRGSLNSSELSIELLLHRLRRIFQQTPKLRLHDEQLWNQSHAPDFPPTVLFNMHRIMPTKPTSGEIRCLRDALVCQYDVSCRKRFDALPDPECQNSPAELATNTIAQHYRMTSFSFNAFLIELAGKGKNSRGKGPHQDVPAEATGNLSIPPQLTGCDVFPTLFWDVLHPRYSPWPRSLPRHVSIMVLPFHLDSSSGNMLFADMLVNYLSGSVARYRLGNAIKPTVQQKGHDMADAQVQANTAMPESAGSEAEALRDFITDMDDAADDVWDGAYDLFQRPLSPSKDLRVPRMLCYGHASGFSFNGSVNTIKVRLRDQELGRTLEVYTKIVMFHSVPSVCSVRLAGTGPMRLMASPRTVKI